MLLAVLVEEVKIIPGDGVLHGRIHRDLELLIVAVAQGALGYICEITGIDVVVGRVVTAVCDHPGKVPIGSVHGAYELAVLFHRDVDQHARLPFPRTVFGQGQDAKAKKQQGVFHAADFIPAVKELRSCPRA